MFLIEPVGVLFTSTLVGLMAIEFLLLSSITTAHVHAAVYHGYWAISWPPLRAWRCGGSPAHCARQGWSG